VDLEAKVEKMYEDLYVGRGKHDPPVISRLALVEDAIQRFAANSSKTFWALVAVLGTVIGDIIFHAVVK
jgi:hypothetical protein